MSRFQVITLKSLNQTQNVTTLTDIELLERLSSSDEDIVYNEFVNRYYKVIKKECLLKCAKRKLDKHIGEQIAHDTFARVRKSRSFDKSKLTSKDEKKAIIGWLYRIQSNLFYDYHKSQNAKTEKVEFYFDELVQEVKLSSGIELSDKRDIAAKIFSKLSPKQRIVILKDIEYKRFQKYHKTDVLDELADELGVTKSSIRKIRERAIKKIKDAIDEING
jgi:RNA polymerase sigma factor (sigma-70 family)